MEIIQSPVFKGKEFLIGRCLYRPQSLESCLLRFRQPGRADDVQPTIGPLSAKCAQARSTRNIPELDGFIVAATGQSGPIEAEGDASDPTGMPT